MEIHTRFKNERPAAVSGQSESRDQLTWAKFNLAKRTVYWLLILLTVCAISTPAIAALIARTEIGRHTLVVAALMTGTIGCVGRLLSNSLKLIFTKRD